MMNPGERPLVLHRVNGKIHIEAMLPTSTTSGRYFGRDYSISEVLAALVRWQASPEDFFRRDLGWAESTPEPELTLEALGLV